MRLMMLGLLALPALAGCATNQEAATALAGAAPTATATLADARGSARGAASLTATAGAPPRLAVRAHGMAPGTYAIHVHAAGRCDRPDFASAGPHWNPAGRQHGTENPAGPHAGDLPNLAIAANGTGTLDAPLPAGLDPLDADGAAVIIHAAADDYRTDPSGNSGARLVCGVFRRS